MKPKRFDSRIQALGICLGASTLTMVEIEGRQHHDDIGKGSVLRPKVIDVNIHPHGGNPKKALLSTIKRLDPSRFDRIVATGRKFRDFINLTSISEPEAVEYAYRYTRPDGIDCPAVVSAGGETFMVYVLNHTGRIINVITGNKCASGTGEFFLQQLRRMNVTLEEAARWTATEEPYLVSGRCSVFCKSDCTHATNKGIPRAKVTAGLCKMMADKISELLKNVDRRNIMITGGSTQNAMMVEYLRRDIPGLIVPEEATYFEALGAALWALEHETRPLPDFRGLVSPHASSFDRLPPLHRAAEMVTFKHLTPDSLTHGGRFIVGLDVGSTTTKAVLMRWENDAIVASVYLRTGGDPVGAARDCYRSLLDQVRQRVNPDEITIEGLGVCGSGRQIAGLHALTDGIINEIIAHAAAAVYFDPEVDTIFEIGGQDAKYTYIVNGVPSDYAMNEACSAGTGSFLEESALETLKIPMEDIAEVALKGRNPPNFNDQCAAFISSDIKNAIHEGLEQQDIVAGLVYSVCMNYSNRVKGNRPVGRKIFMQGGVCYNRAVPMAMASLLDKPIVVPPEPGLMGAFGAALEIKRRVESGLLEKRVFDLEILAERDVAHGKSFTCAGGADKCDRRCLISRIRLEGKSYPFGGACNRYYNLRHKVSYDVGRLDLVTKRQRMILRESTHGLLPAFESRRTVGRIGMNRSFLVNQYYPLYATFFYELGLEVILPEKCSQEGVERRNAPFCFPGELAHGFFYSLLQTTPPLDYIFLPHFRAVPNHETDTNSQVCPLVQGEPFYLQKTFRKPLQRLKQDGGQLLTPLIDLTHGIEDAEKPLVDTAAQIGFGRGTARKAFRKAIRKQQSLATELQSMGADALRELESDPQKTAVVLFGRPYNAYVPESHMGIPHKLASRGVMVIPLDCLNLEGEASKDQMYWGMGQLMLKAARMVEKHPQLFGVYITNFSCGPDSFIIGYFREIMGRKPSLTLELDSHTADAGLETRIEAFLDIVDAYRNLVAEQRIAPRHSHFVPARCDIDHEKPVVVRSDGEKIPLTDPRVTLLFPSMGRISTECLAAMFQGKGLNAKVFPQSGESELKTGRASTSCKECLPLILTTGTLLNYINNEKKPDEILVYFMAGGSGPCRFGQYSVFMNDLIKRMEIPDVALLTLSSENAYAGLDSDFQRRGWWTIDVMEDIRAMLLADAKDVEAALQVFEDQLTRIKRELMQGEFRRLERQLFCAAEVFGRIDLKRPPAQVPKILLAGEIFVRKDSLSRQRITRRLAEQGFATICAPVTECWSGSSSPSETASRNATRGASKRHCPTADWSKPDR